MNGTADHTDGVAIILVSWNQREDALACLESLGRNRWKNRTVLLVDNGSLDGTVEAVRAAYPQTVVIEESRNLGFAAANNRGIRLALEQGFPYILLLNTDTVAAEDMIDPLVEAMRRDPRLGIAGPKMYFFHEPDRIWFAGWDTDPNTGHSTHFRFGETDTGAVEEDTLPCSFITGAGMFVRSEVFHRVGLLDETYFHTAEDNDLCIRAGRAGFRLACVPRARLWHKVMSSTGGTRRSGFLYTYYEYRNKLMLIRNHSRDRGWIRKLGTTVYKIAWREKDLLVRERNPAAAAALLLGIADFALGRSGQRSFPFLREAGAHPNSTRDSCPRTTVQ